MEEEKIISHITIYPNPATTNANIVLNSLQNGETKIIMLDMLGKNVLNIYSGNIINGTNYFTVDISALPAGMYFIIAEIENNEVVTQKLIVE
ncbi:MAG: T9SS type A sorting domain-containing protein [Fimbriimonadaceae bacterium]|nr:T9SS type A sorting domain-containing protein [Chitinophagales bacterium]